MTRKAGPVDHDFCFGMAIVFSTNSPRKFPFVFGLGFWTRKKVLTLWCSRGAKFCLRQLVTTRQPFDNWHLRFLPRLFKRAHGEISLAENGTWRKIVKTIQVSMDALVVPSLFCLKDEFTLGNEYWTSPIDQKMEATNQSHFDLFSQPTILFLTDWVPYTGKM